MDFATRPPARATARHLLIQFAAAAALLAGCGGGGDAGTAPFGTGTAAATSSYAAGAISGFGSVIVNGVRFDNSKAKVSDDDIHAP